MGFLGGIDQTEQTEIITSTSTDTRQTASGSGITQRGGALGEGATNVTGRARLTINTLDADLARSALESSRDIFGQALSQIGSLAESKQTEGEAGRNKIMMWVALAALAVVAIVFWRSR